jgi:Subtilase family
MSLGGPGSSSSMDQAIFNAAQEGVLVVGTLLLLMLHFNAMVSHSPPMTTTHMRLLLYLRTLVAAGNENQNACLYQPASSQYALTVGSIDMDDSRSSFSNFGSCVQVFAPGRDITSSWWTSDTATNTISGTSMATPHVAGIAALFWEKDPSLSVVEVMGQIIASNNETSVQNADGPENRNGIALTAATFVEGFANTTPLPQVCHYSSASALFVSSSQIFILALPMLMVIGTFW